MKRTYHIPLIIGILILVLIALIVLVSIVRPQFYVQVQVPDVANIQTGDKLYMNGENIGKIQKAVLNAPGDGVIRVTIFPKYKTFLNPSTVFTIAGDPVTPGRNCLQSKNCLKGPQGIERGHVFNGMNGIRYAIACIDEQASEYYNRYLREFVEKSIKTMDELSEAAIEEFQKFEAEHHDEFVEIIEQLKREMERIPPLIEKQLEELLNPKGNTDSVD